MSASTHQIAVKAVDQTAGAFGSIQNRAAAASAKIRGMLGGAIAAAGAYMGFSAIKGGIDTLGHLSDVAMKTSTSVDELTGAATALGILGIQNMSIENLAKSFDYMAKTTGRAGMAGFYQTIEELGKIQDVALRGQEAMRIFGRSGMEFMPLINAADVGTQALSDLVQAMPRIPQAAANAGDAASDAMAIAASGIKSIWLQGLSTVVGWFDNEYVGGTREAAARASNYLEYYAKTAVARVITLWQKFSASLVGIGETLGAAVGATYEKLFGSGGTWGDVWDQITNSAAAALQEYDDTAHEIENREEERTERFKRAFEDKAIAIEKFSKSYNEAAISTGDRQLRSAEDLGLEGKAPTIRNELMLGGSNKSLATALMGPTFQSESKKQTGLLGKIAKNTEATASNTEANEDLGVL